MCGLALYLDMGIYTQIFCTNQKQAHWKWTNNVQATACPIRLQVFRVDLVDSSDKMLRSDTLKLEIYYGRKVVSE